MVTAAAALLALLLTGAAEARRARFDPFADFLGSNHRARHHRAGGGHAARGRDHAASDHSEPAQAAPAEPAATPVPLPQPRPAEVPQRAPQKQEAATAAPAQTVPAKEQRQEAAKPPAPAAGASGQPAEKANEAAASPAPPMPSACRLALTEDIAIAPSVPSIHGPGDCGGDDLVRLEAIVLPDQHKVKLTPPATLRCHMASEITDWVRSDVAPIARDLGELATLDNYDSYECRNFNGKAGAHLSEHGHANALDVHGFGLEGGREIVLTDRSLPRELREKILWSVCRRFTTVLGPDSDGYHEDHIHIDLMERRNNYRICEWDVLDPMPQVAPLLPAERPAEAPPRQVAAGPQQAEPDFRKPDPGAAGPASQGEESEPVGQPKAVPAKPADAPELDKPGQPAKISARTEVKPLSKRASKSPRDAGASGARRARKKRR